MRPYRYVQILLAATSIFLMIFLKSWWAAIIPAFLLLLALAAGAVFIRLNFFLTALHHGDRSSRHIALTFDDGPAAFTGEILDILQSEQVQAAFFTIGERAAANPLLVRRWADEGHIIGNHSYHHGFWFDMLPTRKVLMEINATNAAIKTISGREPRLFRPPYGVTNPAIARAVGTAKIMAIGWSLRSFDTKAKSPEALVRKIMAQLKGGDVILLHDSMAVTAAALTPLIKAARAKGFTFVRLDQLLNIQPYA